MVAVITDIHSNYIALENALSMLEKEKPEAVIFLGDYVSDCPYPERTMKLIYEAKTSYRCFFVRGNREDYLLGRHFGASPAWTRSSSTGSLLYTYEHLTSDDLAFFSSLPHCIDISLGSFPVITACHASPLRTKEWIKGNKALTEKYLSSVKGDLLLCGHTHLAGVYNYNGRKALFCPSLGLRQDKSNDFSMTYLSEDEMGKWKFKMVRVPFDEEQLIRDFYESGLIYSGKIWSKAVIKAIRTKIDYPFRTVSLAWEMAKKDGYKGSSALPEQYWEAAAFKLGIEL